MTLVLGIDLATAWKRTGSALLGFEGRQWSHCRPGAITWPVIACEPEAIARAIHQFAVNHCIQVISIDAPQAWRDPHAIRQFCGRSCEEECATPGKTGVYGNTFPRTWLRWVSFGIRLFDWLLGQGGAVLVNDSAQRTLSVPPPGCYYLSECFPSSTWRTSGLRQLPGHDIGTSDILEYAERLRAAYELPPSVVTENHDDLQAVVAALPAAAFMGGPCSAIPRGEPARIQSSSAGIPEHRIEGLIWDAEPRLQAGSAVRTPVASREPSATPIGGEIHSEIVDAQNPILPDERDPETEAVMSRGTQLFVELVQRANSGQSVGVSYSQFIEILYDVKSFADAAGHRYRPSDTEFVICLARRITETIGRQPVAKNGVSIQAGMDTFIWSGSRPHDRPAKAFQSRWCIPPYTQTQWRAIFPDGTRSLLPPSYRLTSNSGG